MIKLVKQEGSHDCAAACLAMVLGMKKSRDVYPWLGGDPSEFLNKGAYDTELLNVLEKSGRSYTYHNVIKGLDKDEYKERKSLSSADELRARLNGQQTGCAIVAVPSLNHERGYHFVVCYRGEIFDPSNEKMYIGTAYSLPVDSVVFIKEAP